jgi:hypothetical protein
LTATSYSTQVRVAAVATTLLANRGEDRRSDPSAVEARIARFSLVMLVPLVAVGRILLDPGWVARAMSAVPTAAALVAAVALVATGTWWVWQVTTPPYTLRRTRHRAARSRATAQSAAEQLAVRLAAVSAPAWEERGLRYARVADAGQQPDGITIQDALAAAARYHDAQAGAAAGEGRIATVTSVPFVLCLLPALAVILLV